MKKDDPTPFGPEFAYVDKCLSALNESRYADAIRLLDNELNQHLARLDTLDVRALIKSMSMFINYLDFQLEKDFGLAPEENAKPEQSRSELRCSFCGNEQSETRKLIAGPEAIICEECIKHCANALAKQ